MSAPTDELIMQRSLDALPAPPACPAGCALEEAGAAAAEDLARLLATAFAQPWTPPRILTEFFHRPGWIATLVLRRNGTIVGTASIEHEAAMGVNAYLRAVAVARAQRGRGLGGALVGAALQAMRMRGYRRAFLFTEEASGAAIRLFLRAGFRPHWGTVDHERRWRAVARRLELPLVAGPGSAERSLL